MPSTLTHQSLVFSISADWIRKCSMKASGMARPPVAFDIVLSCAQSCPTRRSCPGGKVQMSAYWVARARITDPVQYKKYTDGVPAIIARHGGKVLARGGRFEILEGSDKF